MSDVDVHIPTEGEPANAPIPFGPPKRRWRRGPRPPKPRLRKLRLLLILTGLGALALVSTVFGMMMAVASDLPQLENNAQYKHAANSYMYDDQGRAIGLFAPPDHRVIDTFQQINPTMRHAIVAVEDKRFWSESGVDIRGIARAFVSDITGGPREGASTIPEQFVKNALAQEDNRTVFEKLREAALAYHLTREWKKGKILQEYLNSIYFGNGAYGIESAARVYFGKAHGYDQTATVDEQAAGACGDATPAEPHRPKCASVLKPWESALLAGMVANPTAFDPLIHRTAAIDRRNLVLRDMLDQHYISRQQYEKGIREPVPSQAVIQQPAEPPAAPYFTSWLRPQVIAALEHEGVAPNVAAYRAFYGGLKIRTTLDLQMQQAAQTAVNDEFGSDPNGPTAALVAIDNHTGEVRAMVSGNGDYNQSQFNLATEAHRQAGSSFKVFTLAEALRSGDYGPDSIVDSAPQDFIVPHSGGKEHFIVHNFGNTYSGPISLQEATDISDNSVFSQVGIHTGTKRIARLAHQMGIRTPVSDNYAMILGAPKIGPSVLDMAHAYETLATGGLKVYNPILGDMQAGTNKPGPTGIQKITCPVCPQKAISDHPTYKRIVPATVAETEHSMLEGVVSPGGTGDLAAIPGVVVAGKTGTTSNYVDAWFVGWTPQMTTAVWVGFPKSDVPMSTLYNGAPVEGGTYPAIIWHNFMEQALQIMADEAASHHSHTSTTPSSTVTNPNLTDTGTNPTNTATSAAPPTQTTGTTGGGTPATGGTNNTGTPGATGGGQPATGAPAPTDTTGGGGGPTQAPAGGGSSGGTGTTGGAGIGGGG
jgi:penicillin-binding protein 1A